MICTVLTYLQIVHNKEKAAALAFSVMVHGIKVPLAGLAHLTTWQLPELEPSCCFIGWSMILESKLHYHNGFHHL